MSRLIVSETTRSSSIGWPKPRSMPSDSAATSSASRRCARSVLAATGRPQTPPARFARRSNSQLAGKDAVPLSHARTYSKLWLLLVVIATALPAAAEARSRPEITVMSRNLFLGGDLGPAIGASTIPQAIDGAGVIWNEVQSTRFPERAAPLAREI